MTSPAPASQLDLLDALADVQAVAAVTTIEDLRKLCTTMPDGSPVVWVAPFDTSSGLKAGARVPGHRCPVCGEIEANAYWLQLQHGFWLSATPWAFADDLERLRDGRCARIVRAAYRRRVAADLARAGTA